MHTCMHVSVACLPSRQVAIYGMLAYILACAAPRSRPPPSEGEGNGSKAVGGIAYYAEILPDDRLWACKCGWSGRGM